MADIPLVLPISSGHFLFILHYRHPIALLVHCNVFRSIFRIDRDTELILEAIICSFKKQMAGVRSIGNGSGFICLCVVSV